MCLRTQPSTERHGKHDQDAGEYSFGLNVANQRTYLLEMYLYESMAFKNYHWHQKTANKSYNNNEFAENCHALIVR